MIEQDLRITLYKSSRNSCDALQSYDNPDIETYAIIKVCSTHSYIGIYSSNFKRVGKRYFNKPICIHSLTCKGNSYIGNWEGCGEYMEKIINVLCPNLNCNNHYYFSSKLVMKNLLKGKYTNEGQIAKDYWKSKRIPYEIGSIASSHFYYNTYLGWGISLYDIIDFCTNPAEACEMLCNDSRYSELDKFVKRAFKLAFLLKCKFTLHENMDENLNELQVLEDKWVDTVESKLLYPCVPTFNDAHIVNDVKELYKYIWDNDGKDIQLIYDDIIDTKSIFVIIDSVNTCIRIYYAYITTLKYDIIKPSMKPCSYDDEIVIRDWFEHNREQIIKCIEILKKINKIQNAANEVLCK